MELARIVARLHAAPARITARMDAASGFQAIAWACLVQLVAAYPQVIAAGSPEAVHQTRVAIRRLRAALRLFRPVANDAQAPLLRAGFRAAAAALGPARDLHVMIDGISEAAESSGQDVTALLAELKSRQRAATKSAAELLAGAPFQQLLLRFSAWIEAGEWLALEDDVEARRPLDSFAERELSRRRRKLRRHGDELAAMSDAERHALRIDVKNLRYASEFLAPAFPGKSARSMRTACLRELATLQDCLGELNDRAVAAPRPQQLAPLLAIQDGARDRLLARGQKALDRLLALPAWWEAG